MSDAKREPTTSNVRRPLGRYRAVLYAALVHLGIAAALLLGFQWTSSPPPSPPQPVHATVVEDPEKRKLEEAQRREEAERRRVEAERERQRKEEDARKRAEEQRKAEERRRAEEQQRKLEAQRREQERKAEAERKRQADIKRKQEEERQRKEKETQRKQAEAERKRAEAKKKEEDQQRRKADEQALKEQLAAEEQTRAEAARAAKLARSASEIAKYKELIRASVTRNWIKPFGWKTGQKCVLRVRVLPGGDVIEPKSSCGNAVFDRSVETAVRRAAPLPVPTDPDLFEEFRDLEFPFEPKG